MNKNLLNKLWLRVGMIVAIMTTALAGTVKAETIESNFTDKNLTVGTDELTWTASPAFNSFESSNSARGAQSAKSTGTITLTAGSSLTNISKIEILCSSNATGVAMSAKVGNTTFGTSQTLNKENNKTITFTSETAATGVITISANRTKNGTFWVKSITVTYTPAGSSTVAAPTFSPAAGVYTSAQNVTLSCETTDAIIYYTTDGTDPTTSSSVYSSPISVSETTTIKAMAVKSGMDNSSVASATYTIVQPLTTMDAIFAAATSAGDTATPVAITFNNWVVTGATTKQAYVTDGTKGFIIFNNSGHGFVAGNVLSGTAVCKVQLYNGSSEITELTSTTTGLTVATGGTVTPVTNLSIADLSGINTGAVFSYENLAYDGTNLSDGTNTIKPYTTLFTGTFVSGKSYNVTGVYLQFNDTKEILPRSADDIEELGDDPIVFNNISEITELNTAYRVKGTVVATNARGLVIGDGTGYVYYYKGSAVSQSVGDMISIYGNSVTYGQILQFNNTATVAEETSSSYDNTPAVSVITEVPDYTTGYHLSTYLQFEGELSKDGSNYLIALGEDQIQISYPTSGQGTALTALVGKTVLVKGYFSGINSSSKFTVMLESVEEVLGTDPIINVASESISLACDATSGEIEYTITNPTSATLTATLTTGDWISNISVDAANNKVTFTTTVNSASSARTGTITLSYTGAEDVIVTVTQAASIPTPATGDKYVRISSLDQLRDGSIVIIAARHNETANSYYAMANSTSGKPTGVQFTSEDLHGSEIIPATITDEENNYYWVVNVTSNGYTFTNASGNKIGYSSSTNFATNGDNTVWTIERGESAETAMVTEYTGFVIRNYSTLNASTVRAFAFNGSAFGAYATSNMNAAGYNFFLDFFVQTPTITIGSALYTTYVAPAAVSFPEDYLTAYIVTACNSTSATLAPKASVPVETAVVVKATEAGTYTLGTTTTPESVSGNLLLASDGSVTGGTGSGIYALAKKNGKVGFYPVGNNPDTNAPITVPAGKAYLEITSGETPVKGYFEFGFEDEDDPTGISTMDNGQWTMDNVIYNVAGQRLQKMQKGINIVNGRKIAIK